MEIVFQGDTMLRFMELTDKDPWITDGSADTVEQIRGMGIVPKRALDVMECEVNRLLLLSSNAVIPLPYIVPRKVCLISLNLHYMGGIYSIGRTI